MEQISQKRMFPLENIKNEDNHRILHPRISLSAKFQLILTTLIFWTEFLIKGFPSLKEKE